MVPGKLNLRRSFKDHNAKPWNAFIWGNHKRRTKKEAILKDKRILIVDDEPDISKDQMAEIDGYLVEIIQANEKSTDKSRKWLDRLRPVFDKKFGPDWKAEHKEFWPEYDRAQPVTRHEAEK